VYGTFGNARRAIMPLRPPFVMRRSWHDKKAVVTRRSDANADYCTCDRCGPPRPILKFFKPYRGFEFFEQTRPMQKCFYEMRSRLEAKIRNWVRKSAEGPLLERDRLNFFITLLPEDEVGNLSLTTEELRERAEGMTSAGLLSGSDDAHVLD
jgi:hypothetical protein